MAALGFQALRSKTPRTRVERVAEKTGPEAELGEAEIELGSSGDKAAEFVERAAGRAVAERVAAVLYNS